MADQKLPVDAKIAFVSAMSLVGLGVLIGDDMVGAVLALPVFLLLMYAATRVPLRVSLLTLMAAVFVLENPAEGFGSGVWSSAFVVPSAMLLNHLNTVKRELAFHSWMSFSGMDILLVTLLLVTFFRENSRSRIDAAGRVQTPKELLRLALLCAAGMLYMVVIGLLKGGIFGKMLWQLDRVMYLPTLFYLFHMGFRTPEDSRAIAKVILWSAGYKAILATYIMRTTATVNEYGAVETIPCATTHHDSMLFAACFVLILTMVIERVPKARKVAALMIPLIACGMVHNNRRMAWVQTATVFLTIYLVSKDNPVKKAIRKYLKLSIPGIILYIILGWNRGSKLFKPVQMMKSVVDAKTDGSSFWRELENFNLIQTLRSNPVLGLGYGTGYTQFVAMPEVAYELEYWLPHNSILGLWCFGGIVGFSCITLLWAGGVYFSMRAYHAAKDPYHRVAAQVCFGVVLIYMIQCWGDLGLGTWVGVYLMAPALAIGGKLAVLNGQWIGPGGRSAPAGSTTTARPRRAEQVA